MKFSNEDDLLPAEEADAERLYRIAYQQILPVYQAIAKASVLTDGPKPSIEAGSNLSFEPSMHNSFMTRGSIALPKDCNFRVFHLKG